MNKNMIFLMAAVAAVLVMSKKAGARPTTGAAPIAGANPTATNLNNQLWSNVLGGAWKSLVAGGTGTFLMRNDAGQVTTSDGRPIDSAYSDISDAISTGFVQDVDVSAGGVDWLGKMGW